MADQPQKISRDDLEARFRAIKGEVDQRTLAAKDSARPFVIGGAVLLLLLTYLIGKRVGKRKSTVVEIRRI